ncbi:Peptidase family T4 [Taphrina deformans PYCC 5710]|uniref:Peptidase family T4 n=1 Tax=Taphrina deformans (strain PYCC 5710 / ATCC 11124 / CBS 356.35 / IMI 108563 / JCM 9778 / NBRC 8474) TaxID=1097556 RepID=R4X766_TAPDE|nr:Peptidase family T4 [Taphrina deformans PYCC 5710]|eukprot:CCG81116.1 Peptidase family T4 [Taphrina deformans PYCC 5710]
MSDTSGRSRCRIREILPELYLGRYSPGKTNSLIDVSGVLVHTQEIKTPSEGKNHAVNTGITTILPRKDFFDSACYAGIFRFNGSGEMTGVHWIEETGLLQSPIMITNSFATGAGIQGVLEYCVREHRDEDGLADWFIIPVIAETFDGYLSDIGKFSLTPSHFVQGIDGALESEGVPPREGNTGGGAGMICAWFKGGTGSSSRVLPGKKRVEGKLEDCEYTISALVQANYGRRDDFRVGGVNVGRYMGLEDAAALAGTTDPQVIADKVAEMDLAEAKDQKDGSIIIVLATDIPLSALQLQRLAKRGTVGLSRVGGMGFNTSGDVFIAFSTAARVPCLGSPGATKDPLTATPLPGIEVLDDYTINALFEAASDAVEESIYNAVCMAETTTGPLGRVVKAMDLDRLRRLYLRHGPKE